VSSTSFAAISASGNRPANSIFNAVPPKTENQTTARTDGTTNTPMMNSLIVLPFEILAINRPTKGDQDICHAQKKIVFTPSHSFDSNGFIVNDIEIIFETYPPIEVTIPSNNESVGPANNTNTKRTPANARLKLVKIFI